MKRTLKNGIATLFLLLLLAGGCMTPPSQTAQQRVPSPTSALSEQQPDPQRKDETGEGVALLFTEVRSSGDREGAYDSCPSQDWFELYNAGAKAVSLGNLYITNDPEKPDQHRLPKATLKPGQYIAICCCDKESHPSVSMGIARRGETLYIFTGSKREVCRIDVPPLEADVSWGLSDGAWGYCTEPTPGRANGSVYASLDPVEVESLGVSVSELLISGKYAAVTPDGKYCDFVELHNDTDGPVSLKNWYLSDSADNVDKWPFPDVTVEPDG